MNFSSLYFV